MRTPTSKPPQANAVRSQSDGMPQAHSAGPGGLSDGPDDFRLSLTDQIGDSIQRVFQRHGWQRFAERVNRKKSRVNEWVGNPSQIPAYAIEVLLDMDPDPEFASRLAGVIAARVATRALARQAAGRARIIVEEIAPGRWGKR